MSSAMEQGIKLLKNISIMQNNLITINTLVLSKFESKQPITQVIAIFHILFSLDKKKQLCQLAAILIHN